VKQSRPRGLVPEEQLLATQQDDLVGTKQKYETSSDHPLMLFLLPFGALPLWA
jgi:hypothetical protein